MNDHVFKEILRLFHQLGVQTDVPHPVIATPPFRLHPLQKIPGNVYLQLRLPALDECRHSQV